jgi:hypothetical protein
LYQADSKRLVRRRDDNQQDQSKWQPMSRTGSDQTVALSGPTRARSPKLSTASAPSSFNAPRTYQKRSFKLGLASSSKPV